MQLAEIPPKKIRGKLCFPQALVVDFLRLDTLGGQGFAISLITIETRIMQGRSAL